MQTIACEQALVSLIKHVPGASFGTAVCKTELHDTLRMSHSTTVIAYDGKRPDYNSN